MKQGRVTGITIAVVNLILIIVCGVLYLGKDREKPRFEFEASGVVYREGMDTAGLLEGVRAYDTADGDVSARIVIEKITGDMAGGYAGISGEGPGGETGKDSVTVFYAVSDKAGNVAKASRVFEAVFSKEESREEDGHADSFPGAGIDAELKGPMKESGNRAPEDQQAGSGDPLSPDGGGAEETASPMPSPTPSFTPTPSPAPAETPGRQAREHSVETLPTAGTENAPAGHGQEQAPQAADDAENSAAPVLTLKASEVKVKAGQGPAWVDLIDVLSDDRDNYETLFGNLYVDRYDRNKPGTYQVNVHTEDSDGNVSRSVPLTIIVE